MCGIAGLIHGDLAPSALRAALSRMEGAMVHRGPDSRGVTILPDGRSGLAARRLSIVGLESGNQPLSNEDGSIHAVVNGEIYNHRDLRGELRSDGHCFRTATDAEVVVHLYEQHGIESLNRLQGMFALAIFDSRRQSLLLARDGPGMKPLYFADSVKGFLFASEAKALFASGLVEPEPNPAAINRYLILGYVPAPLSAFRNIKKLAPGEYLEIRPGSVRRGRFWEYRYDEHQRSIPDVEYVEELEHLLSSAVRSHLAADVSVGAVLSGGWDSSLVAAFAAQQASSTLNTYSVTFPEDPAEDESRFARQVSERLGTFHHEIEYRSATLPGLLPEVVRHLEEPCALPGTVAFVMSSLAAQHEKAVVSGDGADELFGGYSWLRTNYPYFLRGLLPKGLVRRAASRMQDLRFVRTLGALGAAEDRTADIEWFRVLSPVHERRLMKPGYHVNASQLDCGPVSPRLAASCRDRLQRRLGLAYTGRLADGILFMTDKMSMAHSLEVRIPFLDRSVVDFALRLPSRLKVRGGQSKIILSHLASRHLPPAVAARPKKPFRVPWRDWTSLPMEAHARALLLDNAHDGPFNKAYLEQNLARWFDPRSRYAPLVARLVILQTWWSAFIRPP